MKVNLTESETDLILTALNRVEEDYRPFAGGSDESLGEAARKVLESAEAVSEKLESAKKKEHAEKPVAKRGGEYLYIYVPDGIRDRELEKALKSKIPENPEPNRDNVFWSTKFGNFVTRTEYADQAREAIRERYGGDKAIDRDPEWASKPNTWQILDGSGENPRKERG